MIPDPFAGPGPRAEALLEWALRTARQVSELSDAPDESALVGAIEGLTVGIAICTIAPELAKAAHDELVEYRARLGPTVGVSVGRPEDQGLAAFQDARALIGRMQELSGEGSRDD